MKQSLHFLLVFVVLIAPRVFFAQTPFFNVYGTSHNDAGSFIHELSSGDIFVAGYSTGSPNGGYDPLAMRLTSTGTIVWNKYYDLGNNASLIGCDVSPTEDIYMLTSSCCVIKIDQNGDTIWTKIYYESEPSYGSSIVATADGGFAILAVQIAIGPSFVKIIRCDANGNLLWSNVYSHAESGIKIVECANSDLVAVSRNGQYSNELLRVDVNGAFVSLATFSTQYNDIPRDVEAIGNDVIIAGEYWNSATMDAYGYVRRVDVANNIVWEKILQSGQEFKPQGLNIQGSTVTIVGSLNFANYSQEFIVQISINGVLQSQHGYYFNNDAFLMDVYRNTLGQVFVTGAIYEAFTPNDSGSVLVLRLNPVTQTICGQTSLNVTITNGTTSVISDTCTPIPSGYSMPWSCTVTTGISMLSGCTVDVQEERADVLNVYPNPATDILFIDADYWGEREFILYNSAGMIVRREQLFQTHNTISIDDLASGIYCYRIIGESGDVLSGKLLKN